MSPALGLTGSSRLDPIVPWATSASPDPSLNADKGGNRQGQGGSQPLSERQGRGQVGEAENVTHLVSHRGSREETFRKWTHPPVASVRTSSPVLLISQNSHTGVSGRSRAKGMGSMEG